MQELEIKETVNEPNDNFLPEKGQLSHISVIISSILIVFCNIFIGTEAIKYGVYNHFNFKSAIFFLFIYIVLMGLSCILPEETICFFRRLYRRRIMNKGKAYKGTIQSITPKTTPSGVDFTRSTKDASYTLEITYRKGELHLANYSYEQVYSLENMNCTVYVYKNHKIAKNFAMEHERPKTRLLKLFTAITHYRQKKYA